MASTETEKLDGAVTGEVRMLIDGELVEADVGQAVRQHQPRHRGGAGPGRRRVGGRHAARPSPPPAGRSTRPTGPPTTRSGGAASSSSRTAIEGEREELRAELVAEVGVPDHAHLRAAARRAARGRAAAGPAQFIDEFDWERELPDGDAFGMAARRGRS